MKWEKMTQVQKAEWLASQLGETQRAIKLMERFQRLTLKWLKRVQAAEEGA